MAHYEVGPHVVGHCLRQFEYTGLHRGLGDVMRRIERPSAASLLLIQRKDTYWIGSATGFVVRREGMDFLITNRHVVWDRDTQPDTLTITHNRVGALGSYEEKQEPLYDASGDPLWYEHPTLGEEVDVIALPLTDLHNVDLLPYDPWAKGPGLRTDVSDPLNIVGFPFGETIGPGFAVWTRGFVASEPRFDWRDLPAFLVDSRTRSGQSGSPVVAYANGGFVLMEGGGTQQFSGGPALEQFCGVYSGRLNRESDLGIVWKPSALREVIEGRHRAERPVDA
jgi:hypothetical protein